MAGERDLFSWHKAVYRAAIDAHATDREGMAWWSAVAIEIDAVVAAPNPRAGAVFISWWHHDWTEVGDSPVRAAQRVRIAARRVPRQWVP